jgi:putative transcriptional regulator
MIPQHLEEMASLYALGALPPEDRASFEEAMSQNPELRLLVRELQTAADLVALASPATTIPAGLRARVLGRAASSRASGFNFHGADDAAGWKELPVRGAWLKLLSLEKARGYAVLLGRLEPGVRYPAHTHEGAEELYILTGDLHIGDRALGPGDFHHADAGTAHGVNYSVNGCTLLAVLPAEHELVQFAMA